jgi:hypothetical protein
MDPDFSLKAFQAATASATDLARAAFAWRS